MLLAASMQMLVCVASLSSPPALTVGAESMPGESTANGATTSQPVTALPPANRPSAFIDGINEVPMHPLAIPTSSNSPRDQATSNPQEGKTRRTVSEWLTRGNRSEPAPNFFARLRKEQKSASDSLLVSRCRSMLLADPSLRSLFIHVSAEESVITLKGNVPTEMAKTHAEQIARKTPASSGIRNELTVGTTMPVQQASFVGASLSMPLRLDGTGFGSTTGASLGNAVSGSPMPTTVAPTASPGVTLGAPIQMASASTPMPTARGYVTQQPASPILSTSAMPPVRHTTMEQLQVAKAPVAPMVLPSGHRIGDSSGRRASIPAPPSAGTTPYTVPAPTSVAAPRPIAPTASTGDAREQQVTSDVAALLSKDPRARGLTYTVRGTEVRLAGSVRTSEDIYAVSQLLDAIPGVDFVSFDNVQFTN